MERKYMGRELNALIAYSLLPLLTIILNLSHSLGRVDTLYPGDSLTAGSSQTIISKNGTFELGFFKPDERNESYASCYIGIWYTNTTERAIVWVANREKSFQCGDVLNVSRDGYLAVFDYQGAPVWSPSVRKRASRAVILDSGNFVLFGGDNLSEIIWQSFDHPGDSWLPGMKFRRGQKLTSWRNSLDPAPGLFSFQIDPSGADKFVLRWNNSVQYWESSGFLDFEDFGNNFVRYNKTRGSSGFLDFEDLGVRIQQGSDSASYLTYMSSIYPIMRVILKMNGVLATEYYADLSWEKLYSFSDKCDVYNLCGVNAKCTVHADERRPCNCLDGFRPKHWGTWSKQEWWSSGCVRGSQLNCDSQNGTTDVFIESNVWLPDYPSGPDVYPAVLTRETCEKLCLRNCSCTAFSYTAPAEPCQIWSGDLFNLRSNWWNSSSLFVRVANVSRSEPDLSFSTHRKTTSILVSVLVAVPLLALLVVALLITRRRWRRLRGLSSTIRVEDSSIGSLTMFTYTELKMATRNFKYKLGSGGFGSVYKGTLTDTTAVAVKKLEGSRIAEKQFRAEISSVGNIHHVNLIRLRGFCAQGSHRLLVYDCMTNGSLNSFLFSHNSESPRNTLDWKTRFGIAVGIARALRYLHDECRDRIIHGDVKPENILLDADCSPKLGDFGLAKLLGRDFSQVLTTTRGTRGYLAPEWISGLPITPKVDVYSFGMTLLEIISGRRNLDLSVQESSMYYFPAWAATEIQQGNMMNIVDKRIVENACVEEVRRATLVSFLCIQNEEKERPSMGQVVLMLEGITEANEVALQVPTDMEDREIESTGSTDSD